MKTTNWLPRVVKSGLFCLLVLVLKFPAAAENHFHSTYEGVVGGNVIFYCPVDDPQKLQFLYFQKEFQKELTLVNGYYHGRSVEHKWTNTRLDLNQTTIHMYGLNLSHTGEYKCHYMYMNSTDKPFSVSLHLSVTAPFSKPLITKRCDDSGCNVTCASHNGYPKQQMTWQMDPDSNQMWKTEELTDPTTKMLNVSSTGYINCSSGEVKASCSVGSTVSDVISVCAPSPSSSNNLLVILATVGILLFFLIIGVIYITHKTRPSARSGITEGHPLEVVSLAGNTGAKDAP